MQEDKIEKDKIRVGILRGGVGDHYDFSLKHGADFILFFLENLSHKYKAFDILVDKENAWHLNGLPIHPEKLLYKVDVVWNLADEKYSNILESFSIPHIGTPSFSSLFLDNREKLKEVLKNINIHMPRYVVLPFYQKDFDGEEDIYIYKKAKEVFNKFPAPWMVRSFARDKDMGVHLAQNFPELLEAIKDGVQHKQSILVEEFILGKNFSTHSVSGFRKQDVYVFPQDKGNTDEKDKIHNLVKTLHNHIGVKNYLNSNLILHPKRGVFLSSLEFNPILEKGSHFYQACESVGAKMHHVIEHMIDKALGYVS